MAYNSSTSMPKLTDPGNNMLVGKTTFFTVITIQALVLFFICFYPYCMERNAATNTHHAGRPFSGFCRRGLQASVLKSIPTFTYSSAVDLDCAICLSDFQEGETGRVLPDCRHYFHSDCIDTWFRSHSNCPLCRARVKRTQNHNPAQIAIQIGQFGATNVLRSDPPDHECGCSTTAGILLPVECPRKSLDLGPELPRWVGSTGEPEGGNGRSPEIQVIESK